MKRRMVRARSMDARAMPTIPLLSISPRADSQPFDLRPPMTPDLSSVSTAADLLESHHVRRPNTLSPLSPNCSLRSGNSASSPGTVSPIGAIQPDLYKKKEMVFFHSAESQDGAKNARLHFKLKYDFDKSDLVIVIIEAVDLGCLSQRDLNDPYVKVNLIPSIDSKERRTEMRRNSSDPFFNETFKFPIPFEDLEDKTLHLQLFDYDKFSRSSVAGEVKVLFNDVDVTSDIEVWGEIKKVESVPPDRPEILLSLSYLPSAGRLTVVILKASNLVPDSAKDLPDPMVKVVLTCSLKKLKKKKTSAKKCCINPIWNEALCFDIAEEELKQGHLVVSVVNSRHGNGGLLGTCVVGSEQVDKEASHWSDMIANPRKAIAMWHPLHL